MSDWQKITTAPMDGTTILLFCPDGLGLGRGHVRVGRFECRVTIVNGQTVEDEKRWREVSTMEVGYSLRDPTHWMAMPEGPTP